MPRPFRFQPPALPAGAVPRPRLVELLARREDHRIVTLTAGPGFGKTALLGEALATRARGRDIWLSCEPADESAEHLLAGLAEAVGGALGADPVGSLDGVLDAVWAQAPTQVCIVLDDVHEIAARSSGAELLGRLTTELAGNGHLVFASRDTIPVPLARIAASGQLVRIAENDLTFDAAELAAFAAAHRVDPDLLRSTGGWPALAQLTVSAGADLVFDYLWEEVLGELGRDRARLLAELAVAGGGDDEMASALAGRAVSVEEAVVSVPLVERSTTGWAVLHSLWQPALRRLLTAEEANRARRLAAEVHRRNGRYGAAIDLLAEAEAWDTILWIILDAERASAWTMVPADFGRWRRLLPPAWAGAPQALLAAGLERRARVPTEAAAYFREAAEGFRAEGDADGELAAISHEGVVRWWLHDLDGLLGLYTRVGELRAVGSQRAAVLEAIGIAAVAHLRGDSASVLAAVGDIDEAADPTWFSVIRWLASVAHRRNGDLERAHEELDRVAERPLPGDDPQFDVTRLMIEWLEGRVDHVVTGLGAAHAAYMRSGDRFLLRESALELACKTAWLGDLSAADALVDGAEGLLPEVPSVLAGVLSTIARSAVAVNRGHEAAVAETLGHEVTAGSAALGRGEGWYWRDRAAIALTHVLVPETRHFWESEPLSDAHRAGLDLARALEAARQGDLAPVEAMRWPPLGVVRTHLPVRWVAELVAASTAARNPPPDGALEAIGSSGPSILRGVATETPNRRLAAAARGLANELPASPRYRLRIEILGPLRLWREGALDDHRELRRRRVRELLCYIVLRRRVRREEVSEELWPDVADPAQNLRVTLNYLQTVLQPDRSSDERPYFLRAGNTWLELAVDDRLEIDAWRLDALLEEGRGAERRGSTTAALDTYRAALPLWRGEPFADVPYALWAEAERARLRSHYVAGAVRAGELLLAAREADEALAVGERAVAADPTSEAAYRLLVRAHLANADPSGARYALERCRTALRELGVEPEEDTTTLLSSWATDGTGADGQYTSR